MNIKKTRIKKIGVCLLVVSFIFIISIYSFTKILSKKNLFYLGNSDNSKEPIQIADKSLEFIVTSKESDYAIVNKIFAEGMNINDFKSVYNQNANYVDKSGSFQQLYYDFDRKLSYSDIEELLYDASKSDIVSLEIIGKSVDDRNIYGVEVGKGDKVLFLDANVHAAEAGTTTFLVRFLIDLVHEYENGNKDVKNALNVFKIALIPSINPDGYEVYNFGIDSLRNKDLWMYKNKINVDLENFKYNANGVDLNRNFPTQSAGLYFKDKKLISSVSLNKTTKRYTYYGGSELGSEPEVRATMYFMLKHYKNTFAYINIHSQGRVIYAGKPNLSSNFNDNTVKFAKNVGNMLNYKVHGLSAEEVGEGNDGSATDFFAELVNGFKFSSETSRLSSDSFRGDKYSINDCSVITLETLNTYTDDPSIYKKEYYNRGLKNMFFSLIDIHEN